MIGFTADFYVVCDGKDLLGAAWWTAPGECERAGPDSIAENESINGGGYQAAQTSIQIRQRLDVALGGATTNALAQGWIREPHGRMDLHLCKRCAEPWAELTGEEREHARSFIDRTPPGCR